MSRSDLFQQWRPTKIFLTTTLTGVRGTANVVSASERNIYYIPADRTSTPGKDREISGKKMSSGEDDDGQSRVS